MIAHWASLRSRGGPPPRSVVTVVLMLLALTVAVADGAEAAAAPTAALMLAAVVLSAVLVFTGRPLLAIAAVPAVWAGERFGPLGGLVSVSDAALVVGGILPLLLIDWRRGSLRVALLSLAVFEALTLVAVVHEPTVVGAGEWVHRMFLVAVSLLIGGFLAQVGQLRLALRLFLIVSGVMAIVAVAVAIATRQPAYPLGLQKNYAGSLLASAVLIAWALRKQVELVKVWRPLLGVLVLGLAATQSRGAAIGLGVGLVVHSLAARRAPSRLIAPIIVGLAAATLLTAQFLPETSATASTSSQLNYSVRARQVYQQQALDIWRGSPVLGAGIRFFDTGRFALGSDPHNVLYLTLAESGVVGVLGLAVLLGGAAVALRRRGGPLMPVALALLMARFSHGLFDIYWVHGSQALPWIITGAALSLGCSDGSQQKTSSHRAVRGLPSGVGHREQFE